MVAIIVTAGAVLLSILMGPKEIKPMKAAFIPPQGEMLYVPERIPAPILQVKGK